MRDRDEFDEVNALQRAHVVGDGASEAPSQPASSTGLAVRSSSIARMRTRNGWLIAFTYRGSSMFVIGSMARRQGCIDRWHRISR
jgi:hypothetical protein